MTNLPELFGSMVFNDSVMKDRLPHETYKALRKTIEDGKPLNPLIADIVANAMKDWAIEKGVTHYTHWFQPLTGVTAEKHDSFISPQPGGAIIMEFSGKALTQGEPDASSFPSGGLRATFEARGYTAWDATSYAFIKDNTLCIPTAFCAYGGEALDLKTPLLRSMKELDVQARRVLKLFGVNAKRVYSTSGAEQEYFIIDREKYGQRKDLIYTGRTLIGARPPKGQELDDHYFGYIRIRISAFMRELNEELWKLGVLAKTEHNEVAPAQHELAPVFNTSNVASDHNFLTMEIMRKVAKRHGLTCLLHEKPFDGINGSGKHNNWSLCTDSGMNLLDPGSTPSENAQFLTFLAALILAVDEYQDLLRISIASAGNDHRLGANEAPPAIVSMFVGDELGAILSAIDKDEKYEDRVMGSLAIGVDTLPAIPKDNTDRNRTSPFAFTGNKFEFRMPGSSASIAGSTTTLNTIVAETLSRIAGELEAAEDFNATLSAIIKKIITEHGLIIFNGNGYDEAWVVEAEKRGLLNLRTTVDAVPLLLEKKNVEVFTKHGIYTETELESRVEIMLESYIKTVSIEARTLLEMMHADVIPAVFAFSQSLASGVAAKKALSISAAAETALLTKIAALSDALYVKTEALDGILKTSDSADLSTLGHAEYIRDKVIPAMADIRITSDELEGLVGAKYWPYPNYGSILFKV